MSVPRQLHLFHEVRQPVLAAWGAGVDSTAMLIEMAETGQRVDMVLLADAGGERPLTMAFIPIFRAWLAERGIPSEVVRYQPKNFKNWPAYRTLEENCLTNGTLPSIAFGFGACSLKWKVAPQNRWAETWAPARDCWAAGGKVIKLIGFDCSPADLRRYADREGYDDPRYDYRYPLREWGWTRDDCIARIERAGLPVPPKSSCFFCTAVKPAELDAYSPVLLRRIVLMEARAKPRLRTVDGLWRKAVVGKRGAQPRPGAMTDYIRDRGLLPAAEIDAIVALAPDALLRWQGAVATSDGPRPELAEWLALFDALAGDALRLEGLADLFPGMAGRADAV